MTRIHTHHCQTYLQRKRNTIRRKSVVNTKKMIRQTHHRATIMIHPKTVITDANDVKEKAILSNYTHV